MKNINILGKSYIVKDDEFNHLKIIDKLGSHLLLDCYSNLVLY
jgi:hypothetical protein